MFELNPRLQADCIPVGDLPLCRVLLMNDSHYPWLILVPRRDALREIHELSIEDQLQLLTESRLTAMLLRTLYSAEKLNIAALGNMVPQLHIHHIARFAADPAWPGPVWGVHPAVAYDAPQLSEQLGRIRQYYRDVDQGFSAAN